MDLTAKSLITVGVILVVAGIGWHLGWLQALKLGQLPGDIHIQRENMSFYFPLTTGLLISALVAALVSLISWLLR